jgi:hypothetical protein
MAKYGRTRSQRAVRAGLAIGALGVALAIPAGLVGADDNGGEKYPPAATDPPKVPRPATPIPKTGSDDLGLWLKLGTGAIAMGSIMAVTGSRRRTASWATSRSGG